MRLRKTAVLAIALSTALVAAACGDDDDDDIAATTAAPTETTAAPSETTAAPTETTAAPDTTTGETTTTLPSRGDADLVIWADETRASVIKPLADQFGEDNGIKVKVDEVAFDSMRNAAIQAVPRGTGPDIFIGAHDWTGELVQNGVVAPMDLAGVADKFNKVALEGFTYQGQVYGLPYAVENIALFRNPDLVPTAPATFEELQQVALQLKTEGKVTVPLAVQQDPADPYHNEPMFGAMGGYIFGTDANGSLVPTDIGIDSEGGLAAAAKFNEWAKAGLISGDVTYDIMIDSFANGKAPFAITGPWAISGFKEKNPNVKYVVEAIPPVDGGATKPFAGVQGFMLAAGSKSADLAKTFLVDFVATDATMKALFDEQPRPPAYIPVYDQVSSDPDIKGFGDAGKEATPIPNIPEMAAVWEAFEGGYVNAFNAGDAAGAQQAFKDAASQIRAQLG